jgi:hypothetical protein
MHRNVWPSAALSKTDQMIALAHPHQEVNCSVQPWCSHSAINRSFYFNKQFISYVNKQLSSC